MFEKKRLHWVGKYALQRVMSRNTYILVLRICFSNYPTWRVSYKRQELLTLHEHLDSPSFLVGSVLLIFLDFCFHFLAQSLRQPISNLQLCFQFMDCESLHFELLKWIIRRFSLSVIFNSPVMKWPAVLYLNVKLRQEQP